MKRKKARGVFFIGSIRRFLMICGTWRWNGWVRDLTAKLEGTWLIRSESDKSHELLNEKL